MSDSANTIVAKGSAWFGIPAKDDRATATITREGNVTTIVVATTTGDRHVTAHADPDAAYALAHAAIATAAALEIDSVAYEAKARALADAWAEAREVA
jgi:hypothetical protein